MPITPLGSFPPRRLAQPTEILGAMMVRTLDENLDLLKNPPPPE
jgi:hypothetical protein